MPTGIKQLQKEGAVQAEQELKEMLVNLPPLPASADTQRVDEKTGRPIIEAKDAVVGKTYLTAGIYSKVKVLSINGNPDDVDLAARYVSSVQIEDEKEPFRTLNVAAGTELIEYQDSLYVAPVIKPKETPVEKKEKQKKVPKEKKISMSSIITPMLLEGKHTAEVIAQAVAKVLPEKAKDEAKLARWIATQYIKYLLAHPNLCDGKTPSVKESAATAPTAPKGRPATPAAKGKVDKKEATAATEKEESK